MEAQDDDEQLMHIGIKRKSGRYPWGSGETPLQRSHDFRSFVDDLRSQNMTDTQICDFINSHAKGEGPKFKTPDLRAAIALSTEEIFAENQAMASRLKAKQMSNVAIAERMGTNESTVRGWLKASEGIKEGSIRATADRLKAEVEAKPFLDVGKGTQLYMGISESKLRVALASLRDEGYEQHSIKRPQLATGKMTEYKILTKPGVTWNEARLAVMEGRHKNITDYSDDGGLTYKRPKHEPVSVNLNRVDVRYADDGGAKMDGIIELRRGVEDLSLGSSRYAQVRVAVGGTHFLKGMAMYADDLPEGVDVRFNTNKSKAEAPEKLDAMKPLKSDEGNRFGATTFPRVYTDKKGKEQTSPLNIVNEEGDWDKWSKSLSSQMLSKQPASLAAAQLGKTRASKQAELDTILSLTNPVVKRKLLEEFADSADAAAVHLKAAQLPRQSNHVILPFNSVRPHEIYAPNFDNGDRVVLVRHPHGGPFEIPELTVNNKNLTAKRTIGSNARDAVGIHHSVAAQLSGADFDGDTVLVIANPDGKVKSRPPLVQLKGFDPKAAYPGYEGMAPMSKKNTQTEMGKISNLITDMTIKGANDDEIARAVRHSMVVIDAEKHGLNYKLSERDNGIAQLKTKYQEGATKGASTLISRSSSDKRIPKQKPRPAKEGGPIDPKTGEKVFVPTGEFFVRPVTKVNKRTGEVITKEVIVEKKTKGTQMEFVKDARELSSGTPMEEIYASHANAMKALANQARRADIALQMPRQSAAAKALYSKEARSLEAKLQTAQRNAPLERKAQAIGGAMAQARIDANPGLDKDDIKKINFQSLEDARRYTGANKEKVHITDQEWKAIQAGAISSTRLREILTHADVERVKELATPRPRTSLTPGQIARAKQMQDSGRPLSEIADLLGIPRSTIVDNLKVNA